MVTHRLYYADSSLLQFDATVTDIREARRDSAGQVWEISLDRTAFYPTSGGQPSDTGVMVARAASGAEVSVAVEDVLEYGAGEIWHVTRKPLLAGTRVAAQVDAARRMDHMQQHSGQHLLSACFVEVAGWPTVSFHLGAEISTIDVAPTQASVETTLQRVAELANTRIFEDLAVNTISVTNDEARAMLASGTLRKLPERDGDVRIVEIAGVEHNACGGTHVRSTGQIGGIQLRGVERVRDTLRVEFVCGLRAVRAARADFDAMTSAGRALSVGRDELAQAAAALVEQVKASGKQSQKLLEELASTEGHTLAAAASGPVTAKEYAARSASFLKTVAVRAAEAAPQFAFAIYSTENDRTNIALGCGTASGVNAHDCLRSLLAEVGGKGGGTASLAQGNLPSANLNALLGRLQSRFPIYSR